MNLQRAGSSPVESNDPRTFSTRLAPEPEEVFSVAKANKTEIALILVLLGLCSVSGLAQESALDWYRKASSSYLAGDFAQSARAYEACIKAGAVSPQTYYNAACSGALAGRTDDAFRWLEESIARGWRDLNHLASDSDLKPLHSDSRWQGALEKCRGARDEFLKTLRHPDLHLELLAMKELDQKIRSMAHPPSSHRHDDQEEGDQEERDHNDEKHPVHGSEMMNVDARHTARMKEIVKEYGWPTVRMVGSEGATAAWLLVQHADADPTFQRTCLELMKKLPVGEVSTVNLAYLTDRVLVNEGKKQVYGTQFWLQNGKMAPRPIEDEENLEQRRKKAGMQPFSEYLRHMTSRRAH